MIKLNRNLNIFLLYLRGLSLPKVCTHHFEGHCSRGKVHIPTPGAPTCSQFLSLPRTGYPKPPSSPWYPSSIPVTSLVCFCYLCALQIHMMKLWSSWHQKVRVRSKRRGGPLEKWNQGTDGLWSMKLVRASGLGLGSWMMRDVQGLFSCVVQCTGVDSSSSQKGNPPLFYRTPLGASPLLLPS